MSAVSRKRRAAKRLGQRATWERICLDGALVARDVWEALCRAVPPTQLADAHRNGVTYRGIKVVVSDMLTPGTVMPLPRVRPPGWIDWPYGTHMKIAYGEAVSFEPSLADVTRLLDAGARAAPTGGA